MLLKVVDAIKVLMFDELLVKSAPAAVGRPGSNRLSRFSCSLAEKRTASFTALGLPVEEARLRAIKEGYRIVKTIDRTYPKDVSFHTIYGKVYRVFFERHWW